MLDGDIDVAEILCCSQRLHLKVSKVVRFALSYLRKEEKREPIKPSTLNSSFGMTRPYLHSRADMMALDSQLIMHLMTTLCVIG